jgi:hypothetical protein
MLPSQFPEVQGYPNLRNLLARQVDMLFVDVRTLVRLPMGGLAGCIGTPLRLLVGDLAGSNLTAGASLLNLIAGSSVCFFQASMTGLTTPGDRGRRFIDLLTAFYPWAGEVPAGVNGPAVLYERARNPLLHGLGLEDPKLAPRDVLFSKFPLTVDKIVELEESATRPAGVPPTLDQRPGTSSVGELYVTVPALYWGVHRMLHALFANIGQVTAADQLYRAALMSPYNRRAIEWNETMR